MTKQAMLWLSLGLAALGFLLMWVGTFAGSLLLYLGVLVFVAAMLLGPATRFIGKEGEES